MGSRQPFFDPFTEHVTLFHLPVCPQRDTLTYFGIVLFSFGACTG